MSSSRPIPSTPETAHHTTRSAARANAFVLSIIIAAWAIVILSRLEGWGGSFSHNELIGDTGVSWPALGQFLVGWLVMVAAMMLPSSLDTFRRLAARVREARAGAGLLVAFLGGYLLVWISVGWAAFVADAFLHRIEHAWAWLSMRPWLIGGALLVLTGGVEVSRQVKRRVERSPVSNDTAPDDRLDSVQAIRLGANHGFQRLRRCWPLMLLSFGIGMTGVTWMAVLTGIMTLETGQKDRRMATALVGAVLLSLGLLTIANVEWLPALFPESA